MRLEHLRTNVCVSEGIVKHNFLNFVNFHSSLDFPRAVLHAYPLGMKDIFQYFREMGKQGGKKRAKSLTPAQRKKIARKAAKTRWSLKRRKK